MGRLAEVRPLAVQLLAETPPEEHWVLSRIGSTVASGLHFADRFDLAKPWYEFARQHAIDEGDDVTIDANLHNVAAFRIHNLRLAEIVGEIDSTERTRAEQEFRSSANYDAMKASASFKWMLPLLEMQIDLLSTRHVGLVERLTDWIRSARNSVPARLIAVSLADLALASALVGDFSNATKSISECVGDLPADTATDEVALIRYRQFQVASLCGDDAPAQSDLAAAKQAHAQHTEAQRSFVQELSAIQLTS